MDRIESKYSGRLICGVDEVGRGPLAGPVVACAIIMGEEKIPGIMDSKKLSAKKREELNQLILDQALALGLGVVSHQRIDQINIKEATREAMAQAVNQMVAKNDLKPELVLVDAEVIDIDYPQESLVKGDTLSYNIACASIVAKVYRDRIFTEMASDYPGYGFETNMGYGTPAHREGLKTLGKTPFHRVSFLTKLEVAGE